MSRSIFLCGCHCTHHVPTLAHFFECCCHCIGRVGRACISIGRCRRRACVGRTGIRCRQRRCVWTCRRSVGDCVVIRQQQCLNLAGGRVLLNESIIFGQEQLTAGQSGQHRKREWRGAQCKLGWMVWHLWAPAGDAYAYRIPNPRASRTRWRTVAAMCRARSCPGLSKRATSRGLFI